MVTTGNTLTQDTELSTEQIIKFNILVPLVSGQVQKAIQENDSLIKLSSHIEYNSAVTSIINLITLHTKKARIDELNQGAEYKLLDGMTVYGRHDRSYKDRIAELKPKKGKAIE